MKLTIIDDKNKHNLIRIEYSFITKKDKTYHATVRNLLSYVLVTSTKKYNTNLKLSRELDKLYGASISVNSFSLCDCMGQSYYIDFINPNNVCDDNYSFKNCLDLLNEVIYNPNVSSAMFDETIFLNKKKELYENLKIDKEDLNYLSFINMRNIIYDNNYVDADGFAEDVLKIKNNKLYFEYKKMIAEDDLIICVYGDLREEDKKYIENYNDNINYIRKTNYNFKNYKEIVEDYNGEESYLKIVFNTNENKYDIKTVISYELLSKMIAGEATSILFSEIREKRGLCYNISSNYFSPNNLFIIECEHRFENYEIIKELIFKYISNIQEHDFLNELFINSKKVLINEYYKKYDSFKYNVLTKFEQSVYGKGYTIDEIIDIIDSIDSSYLVQCAKNLRHILTYLLRGIY